MTANQPKEQNMLYRVRMTMDNGQRFTQFVKSDTRATAKVFATSDATSRGWSVVQAAVDTEGMCVLPLDRDLGHSVMGTDWIPN